MDAVPYNFAGSTCEGRAESSAHTERDVEAAVPYKIAGSTREGRAESSGPTERDGGDGVPCGAVTLS